MLTCLTKRCSMHLKQVFLRQNSSRQWPKRWSPSSIPTTVSLESRRRVGGHPLGTLTSTRPTRALLLREHFTELLRTEAAQHKSQAFQQLLRDSETAATRLEAELSFWSQHSLPIPAGLERSFRRISNNCRACHQKFRDVPLSTSR